MNERTSELINQFPCKYTRNIFIERMRKSGKKLTRWKDIQVDQIRCELAIKPTLCILESLISNETLSEIRLTKSLNFDCYTDVVLFSLSIHLHYPSLLLCPLSLTKFNLSLQSFNKLLNVMLIWNNVYRNYCEKTKSEPTFNIRNQMLLQKFAPR